MPKLHKDRPPTHSTVEVVGTVEPVPAVVEPSAEQLPEPATAERGERDRPSPRRRNARTPR